VGERHEAMGEPLRKNILAKDATRAKSHPEREQAKPTKEVQEMGSTKDVIDRHLRSFGAQTSTASYQTMCRAPSCSRLRAA
jgi:hypothetical protein